MSGLDGSFVHLHMHSEYSMLDGAARIGDVINAAVRDGQPGIGITDHGNMYGVLDFYAAAKKAGINPVIGSELYMALNSRHERPTRRSKKDDDGGGDDGKGEKLYYHIIALAETTEGYQNLMKLSSRAYLEGFYYKPRCLAPWQEIVTRNGMKRIKDVQVGDVVMTAKGRWRKVSKTMQRHHDGDIYGVKLGGRYSRTTWMTDEHPVLVRNNKGDVCWVDAKDLVGGRPSPSENVNNWNSWVCLPKAKQTEPFVEEIKTADYVSWIPSESRVGSFERSSDRGAMAPTRHYSSFVESIDLTFDFGYFLGLFIAEGCASQSEVSLHFHQDEIELVDRSVVMIEKLTGKSATVVGRPDRPEYRGISVRSHSTLLSEVLVALCGKGAANKHMPDFVWDAPRDFQEGIIEGIFAGDGSIKDNTTIFTQTSENLAWQVRTLRAALNDDFAAVYEMPMDSDAHNTQYRSNYSPSRDLKYKRLLSDDDYVYKPISEVAVTQYSGMVYNIEVEDDHSYVSDFAMHNCDYELLAEHAKGLIATSGCLGGVTLQALLQDDMKTALERAGKLQDIFGRDNFFIEIQDHGLAEQKKTNPMLIELARKLQAPLLATNDSHYVNREDHLAHDALLCVQTGSTLDDPNRFKFDGDEHYIKSAREMRELFKDYPEACDNTLWIAERANVEIEFGKPKLPEFPLPEGHTTQRGYLRHKTLEGAKWRYAKDGGDIPADVMERLEYELSVIANMGFDSYFLVVWDLVRFAKEEAGIRVGPGRGCLDGDSEILTSNGYKKIRDIEIGDEVRTHLREWMPVTNRFRYDVDEPLVRLRAYGDNTGIAMTKDHKVLVKKAADAIEAEPVWAQAENVEIGDLLCVPRPTSSGSAPKVLDLASFLSAADDERFDVFPDEIVGTVDEDEVGGSILDRFVNVDEDLLTLLGMAAVGAIESESVLGSVDAALLAKRIWNVDDARVLEHPVVRSLFRSIQREQGSLPAWVSDLSIAGKTAFLDGVFSLRTSSTDMWTITVSSNILTGQIRDLLWAVGAQADLAIVSSGDATANQITTHSFFQAPTPQFGAVNEDYVFQRAFRIDEMPNATEVFDIEVARDHSFMTDSYVVHNSAAGCAVAYCLSIVDLDPIKYDLLFERFLNPGRKQMPDIDMDFDDNRRSEMIKYAARRYGWDHVAQIVTFGSIKARAAVRDAARVLGLPYIVGDKIAKLMPPLVMGRDTPLYACLEEHPKYAEGYKMATELRELYSVDPEAKRVIDVAGGLEGLRRSDGIHAAAVVITNEPLTNYLPIQRKPSSKENPEDAPIVTQYEMHGVEDLGLLKMDFLGLRNLSVIERALDLIQRSDRDRLGADADNIPRFDIDNVPLDDEKTLAMLRKGDSIGVFQLEGTAMRALMRALAPTEFEDVAALVALYRPGPMAANMHMDYADRKNGRKPIEYLHEDMAEVLGDTYGLCLAGDTKVWIDGRDVRIDQLEQLHRPAVVGVNEAHSLVAARVSEWKCNGEKETFTLRLQNGWSLTGTADHPILTNEGWKHLGALSAENVVAVARSSSPDALQFLKPSQESDTILDDRIDHQVAFHASLLDDEGRENHRTLDWVRVADVTEAGVQKVYDITVDSIHNFFANGIVVHNCIYQEEMMRLSQKFAGFTLEEADNLRKAAGKKIREVMAKQRQLFVDGCEKVGYGVQLGNDLFDMIEPFADYAFNKSHSYGYGFVSFQTAYLKAHYPTEYIAALLGSVKDDKEKTAVYLAECRALGIEVLVPDVNASESDFIARHPEGAKTGVIPFGLSGVRNVGEGLVEKIVIERDKNGPFVDFFDFCQRVDTSVLNKRSMESLIKAGGFDSLGHTRQGLLSVYEGIVEGTVARRREHDMGVLSLFGGGADGGPNFDEVKVAIPDIEFEKSPKLALEKEMLGLYVSDHPLMGAEAALRKHVDCSISELREGKAGDMRVVGGIITNLSKRYTKRGDLMATFLLEDLQYNVECWVFPKTMLEWGSMLENDSIVCIKGRLDDRDDQTKLVVMEVKRPELILDGGPPVRLDIPPHRLTDKLVTDLKKLFVDHPGDSPVYITVDSSIMRLPADFNVNSSNGLMGELRVLLGADCFIG